VDALYIQFLDATVTTEHLAEGIAADYDAEGRLAGIEILDWGLESLRTLMLGFSDSDGVSVYSPEGC